MTSSSHPIFPAMLWAKPITLASPHSFERIPLPIRAWICIWELMPSYALEMCTVRTKLMPCTTMNFIRWMTWIDAPQIGGECSPVTWEWLDWLENPECWIINWISSTTWKGWWIIFLGRHKRDGSKTTFHSHNLPLNSKWMETLGCGVIHEDILQLSNHANI